MKGKISEILYESCLLFMRLVLMNIYWIIFVVIGLGIFGIVPATISIIEVFRKSIYKEEEFCWTKESWKRFYHNFRIYRFTSLLFACVLFLMFLSKLLFMASSVLFEQIVTLFVLYLLFLVLPYFAVNAAHFSLPKKSLYKNACLLPLFWRGTSVKILLMILAVALLSWLIPGIIPVISFSLPLYLCTFLLITRWEKQLIERRNEYDNMPDCG